MPGTMMTMTEGERAVREARDLFATLPADDHLAGFARSILPILDRLIAHAEQERAAS